MHFQIWDNGDESVGIHGNRTELDTDVAFLDGEDRQEYIESIKETLGAAFAFIWDNGCVHDLRQRYPMRRKWCER
ncbi:MAG: hypothetical protein WC934_00730 [Acidithiobacillus sp.]|jgi:hypothetical protein|uniref:hypothetical protein n=1 Tax=Acidithiobacillus sp. TaxID=1872118 RepID=UPI00355DAEB7